MRNSLLLIAMYPFYGQKLSKVVLFMKQFNLIILFSVIGLLAIFTGFLTVNINIDMNNLNLFLTEVITLLYTQWKGGFGGNA